jgi:hypothetical protein
VENSSKGKEMQFDEEYKVIISTMNKCEAKAFMKFLESEIKRHEMDIEEAKNLSSLVKTVYLKEE